MSIKNPLAPKLIPTEVSLIAGSPVLKLTVHPPTVPKGWLLNPTDPLTAVAHELYGGQKAKGRKGKLSHFLTPLKAIFCFRLFRRLLMQITD